MILEEVTSINLTYLVDFITILLLLLCYIFLGKTFFTGTVFSLHLLSCLLLDSCTAPGLL